jgi:hypothetical protein
MQCQANFLEILGDFVLWRWARSAGWWHVTALDSYHPSATVQDGIVGRLQSTYRQQSQTKRKAHGR